MDARHKAKLAELDDRILAVEREEEFYVCEAAMYNTTIPRRENANPAALLGIEVRRAGANATASGAVLFPQRGPHHSRSGAR